MSPETANLLKAIGAKPNDPLDRIERLARRWRLDVGGDSLLWLRRLGDCAQAIRELRAERQEGRH